MFYDFEKIGKNAHFLFFADVYYISEWSERPCRCDVPEISVVCFGVFVQADKFAFSVTGAFCFCAFVERSEAVIYEVYAAFRAGVQRAVERSVAAASDDKIVPEW